MLPLLLIVFARDLQRPALVEPALQILLRRERRDVLVNRCERSQIHTLRYLLVTGAVTVFFEEASQEIQELLLASCDGHICLLLGEENGKVNRNLRVS